MSQSNKDNTSTPSNPERREMLKACGGILGAAFVAGLALRASSARAEEAAKDAGKDAAKSPAKGAAKAEKVNPKDPTAEALGYVEDAKKADTKKFPKRAGAEGAKQFCYNCMF